jgi:hypothetical protein
MCHVQTRGYCYWWEDDPIRQLVLCENNLGSMDVWELNPEGMVSLSLKATWGGGGIILAEGLHDCG